MEHFKEVVLRTVENLHRLWRRYVNNTFVIQHTGHKENFLQHISTIDQAIKFALKGYKTRWFHVILRYNCPQQNKTEPYPLAFIGIQPI